jgi:N-methylhydantoinase A
MSAASGVRIGVDIGGTFTDVAVLDPADGSVAYGKALSTPDDLVRGIFDAIEASGTAPSAAGFIIHGSTVAINAILERKGAHTALVTTGGFRDTYEIGRINRPDSFNLFFRKHVPLVPRDRVFEIDERVLADGTVWRPFPDDGARAVAQALVAAEIESVAVVFIHAYNTIDHEARMLEILREANPNWFLTASHEVSREQREYERISTTVANAYVGPRVSSYLERLESRLEREGFGGSLLIMQSSGGLFDVATARAQCIQMLESGPAAGVVASKTIGASLGLENLICFDMGGTTAKACVLQRGTAALSADYFVGGYNEGLVIRIPVLDIKEVGTGGGSLAWIDEGGALHVGPESAGASPGPACYGNGGERPTVTDAHLVLGHLSASRFNDGRIQLDEAAAVSAIQTHIAGPLGLDVATAASGILAIANAQMANGVRAVTTERGLDPRDFTLVVYGGAGPLHAVDVARELAINAVIIPDSPGHFSAFGMQTADLRREYARTFVRPLGVASIGHVKTMCEGLRGDAAAWLSEAGVPSEGMTFEHAADIRYIGQEHAVTVAFDVDADPATLVREVKEAFDAAHLQRYSHNAPQEAAELVTIRVSVIGLLSKPSPRRVAGGNTAPEAGAQLERRDVRFDRASTIEADVYDRAQLLVGNTIAGPAVIQEAGSATCVPPGVTLRVGEFGHLFLEVH